ncbi:MAG: ABC transporter substrate-binding protein, partial [Oscillospiraceae bacterium]|nr:ABC transporter substrate-binding protein [Oscillospiraceae bacterium]
MKKICALALAVAMMLSITACGGSSAPASSAAAAAAPAAPAAPAADAKSYNVGICQLVQHPALDAATQGFKDALTEKMPDVKFDEQNASGDAATCAVITSTFAS